MAGFPSVVTLLQVGLTYNTAFLLKNLAPLTIIIIQHPLQNLLVSNYQQRSSQYML